MLKCAVAALNAREHTEVYEQQHQAPSKSLWKNRCVPEGIRYYWAIFHLNFICCLAENFDTKKNELTRQGFMELNLMEANDREGDPADLWVTLESMGYNRSLEMVEVKRGGLKYWCVTMQTSQHSYSCIVLKCTTRFTFR